MLIKKIKMSNETKQWILAIMLILLTTLVIAQPVVSETFTAANNQCVSNVKLLNDNSYIYENSCGGIYSVSYGNYVQKSDSIYFFPFDAGKFNPIKSVDSKDPVSDTLVVRILDKFGKNISHKMQLIVLDDQNVELLKYDASQSSLVEENFSGGKIIFYTLNSYYNNHYEIVTDGKSFYTIQLNVPIDYLNETTKWIETGEFNMTRMGDKLNSSQKQYFEGLEFTRQ